jgi:hypothetical protein
MAPSVEEKQSGHSVTAESTKPSIPPPPPATRARFDKAGIPWQDGYPHYPPAPKYVQDVEKIRKERERDFADPGSKATEADKEVSTDGRMLINVCSRSYFPSGTLLGSQRSPQLES